MCSSDLPPPVVLRPSPGRSWPGRCPAVLPCPPGARSRGRSPLRVHTFTVRVTDALGRTADRALSLAVLAPVGVTTSALPQGTTGTAYSVALAATGGNGTYTWSASGLPAGLSISTGGTISGTPTVTATANVTVTASDTGSPTRSGSRTLTLTVAAPLAITTTTLNNATLGLAYSATLAATGGSGTRTWSIAAGSLPSGISLATTGVLSGTPTANGTASFTVRVADGFGRSATRALSLTVQGATVKVASITMGRTITFNGTTAQATVSVVDNRGEIGRAHV